jgi:hypothetical protein
MLVRMAFVGGCRFSWLLHSIVCVLCMHVALYLITWSEGYWILHTNLSDSTNPFIILETLPWSKQLWQALYKKMKACRIYEAAFKTSISTQLCHCCMEYAGGGFWYCFAMLLQFLIKDHWDCCPHRNWTWQRRLRCSLCLNIKNSRVRTFRLRFWLKEKNSMWSGWFF